MVVEAAVFGRKNRFDEMVGEHVDANMPSAQAPLSEDRAIDGENGHIRRPVVQRRQERIGHARNEKEHSGGQDDRTPE